MNDAEKTLCEEPETGAPEAEEEHLPLISVEDYYDLLMEQQEQM